MTNFFRKDLKLKDKWWHRLFVVIFISLIIFYLYILFSNNYHIPQYVNLGSISPRITNTPTQLNKMLLHGEYFESDGSYYVINRGKDYDNNELFRMRGYCANDIGSQLETVKNITGIQSFSIRQGSNYSLVSEDKFAEYLSKNNIRCVFVDSIFNYVGSKPYWIEPYPELITDYVIYVESETKTIMYVLKELLITAAGSLAVVAVYYKIFIYIVYGEQKKEKAPTNLEK